MLNKSTVLLLEKPMVFPFFLEDAEARKCLPYAIPRRALEVLG